MSIVIHHEILSFADMPQLAPKCERTVLLLRHSMRQSLINGSDPGLTPEGALYATRCGRLLSGLDEVNFGASPRKRTIETAQALMTGGGFPPSDIDTYSQIRDTALFTRPENLDIAIRNGSVPEIAQAYFYTGKAPGTIDLEIFSRNLLDFLTQNEFKTRNTILLSHDIICVSLLIPLKVYPFKLDDWCGYIQGAALLLIDGVWHLHYIVPDLSQKQPSSLFI